MSNIAWTGYFRSLTDNTNLIVMSVVKIDRTLWFDIRHGKSIDWRKMVNDLHLQGYQAIIEFN